MRRLLLALFVFVASTLSARGQSVTVEGVTFEPAASVAGQSLQLNGAGLRTRVVFKVYAAGLYVPQKSGDASALLGQAGARRVAIAMLRDVDGATFTDALVDGLKANHGADQFAALKPQIERLQATLKSVGEAKKGDRIQLDWVPDTGTVITINGQARGEPIAGAPFYTALLRIWLGDKPVDASLKKAMLGG